MKDGDVEQLHREHQQILTKLGTIQTTDSLILREMQKFSIIRFDYAVGPVTNKETKTTNKGER